MKGSTEAASGHISDLLSTLNVDKDEDLQRELFYNSHYSLPKGAKPGDIDRLEEYTYTLIDYLDLTSAVDRDFVAKTARKVLEETDGRLGEREEKEFKRAMHKSRIKHLEEQDSQAAYAQHYINALNPFLTRGGREHIFNNSKFSKEVGLQFLAIQEQIDDDYIRNNVADNEDYDDRGEEIARNLMPSSHQTSFLDYLGAEFDTRDGTLAEETTLPAHNTDTYLDILKKLTKKT